MTCSGRASLNVAATLCERRPDISYDVVRTFSAVYKITLSRRRLRLEDVTATFARRRWNVNMFAGKVFSIRNIRDHLSEVSTLNLRYCIFCSIEVLDKFES